MSDNQTTAHRCMCRDCGPCGCGRGSDGHCETCADHPQTTAAQRRVEAAEDILCGHQITNGPDVQVNEADGTIRIFGTLYTLDLFHALGAHGLAIGAHLKIVGRSDGAVHLQRIFEETDLHCCSNG